MRKGTETCCAVVLATLLVACGGDDGSGGPADSGSGGEDAAPCPSARLVAPESEVPGPHVLIGPRSDADDEPCGETYAITAVVETDAPDGTEATLVIDGEIRRSSTVASSRATFEAVPLANFGADPNRLAFEVGACSIPLVDVEVDCAGVACAITSPDTGTDTLDASDDVSAEPGMQIDVEVTTDAEADGLPVALSIDGLERATVDATTSGTGATATFEAVTLAEGSHTVQATCADGRGNRTASSAPEWTVPALP